MSDTKKKAREKRRPGVLPMTVASILRRVVSGEALTATRHFPYDFEYRFETGGQAKLPPGAIATLVEAGYLTATQSDPCADFIAYHATERGKQYAKDGPPLPDESQLDWTEPAA